ncbi:RHS repeat-associated core domain-containing protein [Chitinophaga sp. CF418]|uniref:RHS repeat-associated core domain-containing protein n=1 Tax=Chitinophaga sp. CF418 TaxID=1855287 RepID=UPI000917AB85|nr:RHS repeat-associated core domain-containing protein [Chitinophaga sp. CF418]SHN08049.1 RHS repeat-associated core domain-containing protein [Chitinophaga sp. CF418]
MKGINDNYGGGYRYGFNGKENDNEVKGEGNQIAFEARAYDSRIGKFLSIDPLASKYPDFSAYAFAADNPIRYVDVLDMGPGDPPSGRKGWKELVYTAVLDFPFYTDTGKENWKALKAAVMPPTLATMNGGLLHLSYGLYSRSAEDIGLDAQYKGRYDAVTFVVGSAPIVPSGGGGP